MSDDTNRASFKAKIEYRNSKQQKRKQLRNKHQFNRQEYDVDIIGQVAS